MKPFQSVKFKKDLKRAKRRKKDISKLENVVVLLLDGEELPSRYKDHRLSGDYAGFRECHLEPDWLLIYRIQGEVLYLSRTGTHADIFRKF